MKLQRQAIFFFLILFSFQLNCVQAQTDTLNVLSWNVFLRPSIMSDKQMKRVDSIAYYLEKSDCEILILQEVFHKKAKKRLTELLVDTYPFRTKSGPKSFYGVPSGVVIYSKLPFINEAKHYSYQHKTGSDKLAKKGLVQVSVNHKGREVAVIGTHLQAGGGEKRIEIRQNQVELIRKVQNEINDSVTLIFGGDFNIGSSTPAYNDLIESLNVQTIQPTSDIKNTCNFSDHNLMKGSGKPYWIDFILLRIKENAKFVSSTIESPRQFFKGTSQRLSDHNPIKSTLVF